MYIHALSLTNVRGFTALEFPLQRPDGSYAGWNVFAGVNGSGKTTLLRAVATMLLVDHPKVVGMHGVACDEPRSVVMPEERA